jgi:hypothetical protein
MKKILFLKRSMAHRSLAGVCCLVILSSWLYVSCGNVYDNIKEFSMEEIVYPAHFDTIYGKIGYERVEIDLSKAGRIPSSQMNLGKAKKTIIEYDGKSITIDSVCSWLNITGLTQPKLYRFKIFTVDEFGDRSTPQEIGLTPYTSVDKDALALPSPVVFQSTTIALVEWRNSISGDLFDFLSFTYSYTDKDGNQKSGSAQGDLPSFFIENVNRGEPVTVTMTNKVIPKLSKVPILDTISWSYPLVFYIEGTHPAIFLDTPVTGIALDVTTSFPYSFSWKRTEEVNDYALLISSQSTFPASATDTVRVGNVIDYQLQEEDISKVLHSSPYAIAQLFWKVIPADGSLDIITQSRMLTVKRKQVKSYPLELASSGTRLTCTNNGDHYVLVTTSADPYIFSLGLPEKIEESVMLLTFDYKVATNFVWEFFFSTPNASGAKMTTSPTVAAADWTEYSFECGTFAKLFEWGDAGHRIRFDPGPNAGLTLYIKNIKVTTFE